MSGYVGNKRSVSFVSAELPIRKGLESIVEEDGSYRLLDGASLKKSDGSTVIHSDGTIEGVDLSPIQNQIDSIEADITSLNSSVDLVEASVNQIPPRLESFRNKIINGDMQINQRGNGTAIAGTFTYTTDRWYVYCVAAGCSYSQVDTPTGKALEVIPDSGTVNQIIGQKIENVNCRKLANQTVIISGKVYIDDATGVTFNTNVYSAASTNVSYGSKVDFSSDLTSGEYVSFSEQVTLPADAVNGVEVDFSFLNAGGRTIRVTDFQFEEGPVATPFEHRPLSVELAMCQRYFQKSYNLNIPIGTPTGTGNSGYVEWNWGAMATYGSVQIPFRQSMRVSPTFSIYNIGSGILNGFAYWDGSQTVQTTSTVGSFQFGENWAIWFLDGTVRSNVQFHWSADAEL